MEYKVTQLEPFLGDEEIQNLQKAVETLWITEGPFSREFIERIKDFTGSEYAVLACNGTLALFLGLTALGIGPGDELIVPDFTFNASAASVAFTGAKPVFVDVNASDLQMDVSKLEALITEKTRAIMPVHVYGSSADMDPVMEIARKHGLKVIEDAAQGFGVFYKNRHTGTIGDVGMISFFADKTITTGEGAVLLTRDKDIFDKLTLLRNQGRPRSSTFIHPALGMNFRMTDLQCAVGVAQIAKYAEIERKKLHNYNLYKELLDGIDGIEFVGPSPFANFVPFRVNIRTPRLEALMEHLENDAVQTRRFFYPLHRQPCYSYLSYDEKDFPCANAAYDTGLSLPVFCNLTEDQIRYVCNSIKSFFEAG